MKKVTDIAREMIAWPMLISSCLLMGAALGILLVGFGIVVAPINYKGEGDAGNFLLFFVVAVILAYIGSHTLLSLGRPRWIVAAAAAALTGASLGFYAWRMGGGG